MRRRWWPVLLALTLLAGTARADEALADRLVAAAPAANPQVLTLAVRAADCARRQGLLDGFRHLAVIDYSLPSTLPRLWVFDVERGRLLFEELVAHGRNSGDDLSCGFSNEDGSHMTSLGAFVTGASYNGRNGYSMRLRGVEPGLNDRAEARAIVLHGAPYVREETARALGRLGRSHGCPAVRPEIAQPLIDEVKDRTLLYAWQDATRKSMALPSGTFCPHNSTSRVT